MRHSVLTILFFLISTAFGQTTVALSGKVIDPNQQAVQGAIVKLFVNAVACTTKADGSYSLNSTVGIVPRSHILHAGGVYYKNNALVFDAPSSVAADVTLYDCSGKAVARIFSGRLAQGVTRVPFALEKLGRQMFLARVKMGGEIATFPLIRGMDQTVNLSAWTSASNTLTNKSLSAAAAAQTLDWLQASKQGYAANIQSISALTGVINIQLGTLAAPNFGTNTKVFDTTMSASSISSTMSGFSTSEFGGNRVAWLFKPGHYSLTVTANYYTQILGLGTSPDSVSITGMVQNTSGTLTAFWREVENMSVSPTGGPDVWAVSQAAPFRRMHIRGRLNLSNGSASGGFIADSRIDSAVSAGSQQQFYTRNSIVGSWNGGAWNMFFHGVTGAPADNWPGGINNNVAQVPLIREKPFLTCDRSGNYAVFVPALRTNVGGGVTWSTGTAAGESIPIDQFYIAQSATDNVTTINAALAQGKNLLLTPGVYRLTAPIQVVRPNTVVLGLGLATLQLPADGAGLMKVADVDGVKIGGILFDAGANYAPVLLQVGNPGDKADHTANPIFVYDLFCREGGTGAGKDSCAVILNSNNVVIDHCWLWRADHGTGSGWTSNTSQTGLVVNGNNCITYGQFVEHHQRYQTIWNGNNGKCYFYQCEMPYDVPNQAAFNHDGIIGYASYKVGANATLHEAWGIGIYAYFNQAAITVTQAIETPLVSGIKFHHCFTFSLGGNLGTITNVINNYGGVCNNSHTEPKITDYTGGQ